MEMNLSSTGRETTIPGFLRLSKRRSVKLVNQRSGSSLASLALVISRVVSARSTSGFISRMFNRWKCTHLLHSHNSSSSGSVIIPAALEPSTQTFLKSRTCTMTLPNGAVVLTIEVITSVQSLTSQATSKSHVFPSYSPTTIDFGPLSTSVLSATPESASSTARASAAASTLLPGPVSPSMAPATPTGTTPTPILLASSHVSSSLSL